MTEAADKALAELLEKVLKTKKSEECPECGTKDPLWRSAGQVGWKECRACHRRWGSWVD